MMENSNYPPGWDEDRVRRLIDRYEKQSEEEAVAEDEAVLEEESLTLVEVPQELVPAVRDMIARYEQNRKASA
jgi:hypothetical protein